MNRKLYALIITLLILMSCFQISFADDVNRIDNSLVESVSLGQTELTLNVGDSYTFSVSYSPSDPIMDAISWSSTDTEVAKMAENERTINAIAPGTSMILARLVSSDQIAACKVTVRGEPGTEAESKSLDKTLRIFEALTESDLAKIRDEGLLNYIKLMRQYAEFVSSPDTISFDVFILFPSEAKEEITAKAQTNFVTVKTYRYVDSIALRGSAEDLAAFLHDNPEISAIEPDEVSFIPEADPAFADKNASLGLFDLEELNGLSIEEYMAQHPEVFNTVSKAITLEGHTEELTSVSTMHNAGFKGQGAVVAVLDTGLNAAHPEFGGRVIRQACFTSNTEDDEYVYYGVCDPHRATVSYTSSYPYVEHKSFEYHGSLVAGIAAGNGGIAPEADIIAINVESEVFVKSTSGWDLCEHDSDICRALDYLLYLREVEHLNIVSANMSFGIGEFTTNCDARNTTMTSLMNMLDRRGITPVAASGNKGSSTFLIRPACISSVYAVGALKDKTEPEITSFTNMLPSVDILAPGFKIYSAMLSISGDDSYSYASGTSMASPIVAGAVALVKDHLTDPAMNVKDALKIMATKTATRDGLGYSKPVLDFTRGLDYVSWYKPGFFPISFALGPDGHARLPETGLASNSFTQLAARPRGLEYGKTYFRLEIPAISSQAEIVNVPLAEDETYAVQWLGADAGLLDGSALPGEGVSVIAAHNHLNTMESGPFLFLKELEEDDRIFITRADGEMLTYKVYENLLVDTADVETLQEETHQDALVLITCENELTEGGYADRRVVFAELN